MYSASPQKQLPRYRASAPRSAPRTRLSFGRHVLNGHDCADRDLRHRPSRRPQGATRQRPPSVRRPVLCSRSVFLAAFIDVQLPRRKCWGGAAKLFSLHVALTDSSSRLTRVGFVASCFAGFMPRTTRRVVGVVDGRPRSPSARAAFACRNRLFAFVTFLDLSAGLLAANYAPKRPRTFSPDVPHCVSVARSHSQCWAPSSHHRAAHRDPMAGASSKDFNLLLAPPWFQGRPMSGPSSNVWYYAIIISTTSRFPDFVQHHRRPLAPAALEPLADHFGESPRSPWRAPGCYGPASSSFSRARGCDHPAWPSLLGPLYLVVSTHASASEHRPRALAAYASPSPHVVFSIDPPGAFSHAFGRVSLHGNCRLSSSVGLVRLQRSLFLSSFHSTLAAGKARKNSSTDPGLPCGSGCS